MFYYKSLYQRLRSYYLWIILIISIAILAVVIPVIFNSAWNDYSINSNVTEYEKVILLKIIFANYIIPIVIFALLTLYIAVEVRTSFSSKRLNYHERQDLTNRWGRSKNTIITFLIQQTSIIIYIIFSILIVLAIDIGLINTDNKDIIVKLFFQLMGFKILYDLFLYPILFR
ncbi:hypothetical protein [Spiroplasma chrysopicola]|uniref:Transmembrane protein n=1 Tax=Spiroplasma chrysopicola DF-1 TaxID=1276227 RepID=R4U173_9MOLU|nr:hypothetical protein [Spiroplasma chrysopicola]AGM25082.1 hypothetical protein SCHRY_v1c05040 [Spiroplasma chrysopicola DF-1]